MAKPKRSILTVAALVASLLTSTACNAMVDRPAQTTKIKVGLITKTEGNTFFLKMKEGASQAAEAEGMELLTAAGKTEADTDNQVAAIERMVAAGVKGILITANDSKAIVPAIRKAREAGVVVIALDSPVEPADATDALFATDNFKAGEMIGRYARAARGGKASKVVTLDLAPGASVGKLRHDGFLKGFGITDNDPSIVCRGDTEGDRAKGKAVMEKCLQTHPDVSVVYTMNEPVAFGAYLALKAKGREKDATIVSVDGGCTGVRGVELGEIAATAQQYPLRMAKLGVEAVAKYAKTGVKPSGYTDTGLNLVTARPLPGVESKDTTYGTENCWGV